MKVGDLVKLKPDSSGRKLRAMYFHMIVDDVGILKRIDHIKTMDFTACQVYWQKYGKTTTHPRSHLENV